MLPLLTHIVDWTIQYIERQAEAAAYLIQSGADTTLLDVNRDSSMHWAAYKGELSIVQLLHHLGLPVIT